MRKKAWRRLRWLLALAGLCALATCPRGWRACNKDRRAREGDELTRYLAQEAARVYATTKVLPRAPAGPTPAVACCDQGGQCAVDRAQWLTPAWRALGFTIDDPHRFSYSYQPTTSGGALIRAIGDVDCDGLAAVIEVRLEPKPDGSGLAETWSRQAE